MKIHLKIRIKTLMDKMYKKSVDDMLFDCFPKISKEEAEELKKHIEQKFKKGENY